MAVLSKLKQLRGSVSLPELSVAMDGEIATRTLRRWLAEWVAEGVLERTGRKRSTQYRWIGAIQPPEFTFLEGLPESRREALLAQLRDLWTHNSTAIEGNTLTLGETQLVLSEGLTVSGKPLKDHQEVTGHSRAIDLVYQSLSGSITEELVLDLHRAVQTEIVWDIYKPIGSWKIEANGTYIVSDDGEQVFLEYAMPKDVSGLMSQVIDECNDIRLRTLDEAPATYAKIHMGVVHIHPFWDGNGRVARLLANVPLLKAGMPPVVIPVDRRAEYIRILSRYQLSVGQLSAETGVWPDDPGLEEFVVFVNACYETTLELLDRIRSDIAP